MIANGYFRKDTQSPVQKAIRKLAAKLDVTSADNGQNHPPKFEDSFQPVT
jgi:hypothetical protein